jgi:hypothetical protein
VLSVKEALGHIPSTNDDDGNILAGHCGFCL